MKQEIAKDKEGKIKQERAKEIPEENKMRKERTKEIPDKKKKNVKELITSINANNTFMIASIENLSASQFQKIKHLLKEKVAVKVIKKNLVSLAIKQAKKTNKNIEEIEKWCNGSFAILLSKYDPFELSAILEENKTSAKIKPNQIAPEDIIIEAGLTELPAGPVISELTKAKIKAGIEGGKIAIKERCVVAKKGEAVNEVASSILSKLEITPLKIGFEPLAAYDSKEQKVYTNIKVDKAETIKELKEFSAKALSLAVKISYSTRETIAFLIRNANQESNQLLNLINKH